MKTETFIKLMRKLIKEEVKSAVREALNESAISEEKPLLDNDGMPDIQSMLEDHRAEPVARSKPKKQYTKNSMLNNLLNDTKPLNSNSPAASLLDHSSNSDQVVPRHVQGTNGRAIDTQNEAVQKTLAAMTKNYSGFMKAVDEKTKQRRGM